MIDMKLKEFFEDNTSIEENEKSIVGFGLNMMITTMIALAAAIIIAFFMNMLPEGILFLVSIIFLRQYAGGYHANSQKVCAVFSCVIYSVGLIIIKNYPIYNIIQLIMCVTSTLIIFFLSPVDNVNNQLSSTECKYLKNKVRFFLCIEIVVFVILFIKNIEYWSGIIAISMMIVAGLVLVGFIENKIRG